MALAIRRHMLTTGLINPYFINLQLTHAVYIGVPNISSIYRAEIKSIMLSINTTEINFGWLQRKDTTITSRHKIK